MGLDAQSAAFVEATRPWLRGPFDLAQMRAGKTVGAPATLALPVEIEPLCIPLGDAPIPARLYRPLGGPPPGVLMFFHGGGFALGGLDSHDPTCRALAHESGCLVISVDYRLAPEHRYPAGVNDAFDATQWAIANAEALAGPGARVAVGGDSAGGTLAIVACLMARDRGMAQPVFQLLIYPGINLRLETPERDALARAGYFLSRELIDWLNPLYCERDEQYQEPYCAPAYAKDLTGLPPALVIAAELDPLREEDETFARRLSAAGVPTAYSEYPGTVHGFVTAFEVIDKGRAALAEAARAVSKALRAPSSQRPDQALTGLSQGCA